MQTTTSKKARTQFDTSREILELTERLNLNSPAYAKMDDFDFFSNHIEALIRFLHIVDAQKIKQPKWNEIYHKCIQDCSLLRKHQSLMFHFRVVKYFWKETSRCLVDLENSMIAIYEKYKSCVGKQRWPSYELTDIQIDYNIRVSDEKKMRFMEKIIKTQCKYFVTPHQFSEDIFTHYLFYLKVANNTAIFTYSIDSYLKYVKNQNDYFAPKLKIFVIVSCLLDYYDHRDPLQEKVGPYVLNIIASLSSLLQRPKYVKSLQLFNSQSNLEKGAFIERLLQIMGRMNADDSQNRLKSLVYNVLGSKMQNEIMQLQNPFIYLQQGCSVIEIIKYLASLVNFIRQMKLSITSKKLQTLSQTARHNLRIIYHHEKTKYFGNLKNYYYLLYCELYIFQKKLSEKYLIHKLVNIELFTLQHQDYCEFLPFQDLVVYFGTLRQEDVNSQNHKYTMMVKLYMLTMLYIIKRSKECKNNLLNYLNHQFIPNCRAKRVSFAIYSNILLIFANLIFSPEFQEIANKCFTAICKAISISHYINQNASNYALIFSTMIKNRAQKSSSSLHHKEKCIFAADAVKMMTVDLINSFQQFYASNAVNCWMNYFHSCLDAFFFFYNDITEEQIDDLLTKLSNIIKNPECFEAVASVFMPIAVKLMKSSAFFDQINQIQFYNLLEFYEQMYIQQRQQCSMKGFIKFIDICFNMKVELFTLFQNLNTDVSIRKKTIQGLINKIDEIEMVVLETTAPKFIQNLFDKVVSGDKSLNFMEILSISIKSIFYVVHEQKFISKLQQKGSKQRQKIQMQLQLQLTMMKLVMIRQKCNKILPQFTRMYYKAAFKSFIGPFQMKSFGIQWNKNVMQQLNELMYIAHLCGIQDFKRMLINIRMSLIHQNQIFAVFLLQAAKYLFVGVLKQKDQILDFIANNLASCQQEKEYMSLIEFLCFGTVNELVSNTRYFKNMYLMKQEGIVFFRDYKNYPCHYFAYFYSSMSEINAQNERIILKSTRTSQFHSLNERQYWTKRCWQEGWMLIKLLIMMNQQIVTTAIQFNQISKIRTFSQFALSFCIKSAHVSQLTTHLLLAIKSNKQLNLMRIVDSLLKLQLSHVNHEAYRQIDRMIFSKRKSISMPQGQTNRSHQISKLYGKIENSFKQCYKTGTLLAEIFCHLAAQQLNLNAYRAQLYRSRIQLINQTIPEQDRLIMRELNWQGRTLQQKICYVEQLKDKIINCIFSNYGQAVIIKDFVSQFIDQVLDQDNITFLSPPQHHAVDQVISSIALSFEEVNYSIKKFLLRLPTISTKEQSFAELQIKVQAVLKLCKQQAQRYGQAINMYSNKLKSSPYPVSVIFPMGRNTFTISFSNKLLVTFTDRWILQDRFWQFASLIQKNESFLKENKNISRRGDKRGSLDRQMGKMCEHMDVGILDIGLDNISPAIYHQYQALDVNIVKFALNEASVAQKHFKIYSKRFRIDPCFSLAAARERLNYKANQNENLLILIHEKYLHFPFEIVKSVRRGIGVYRLPSIQYLFQNKNKKVEYSMRMCKYLVNTKNDLKETEKRFEKIKKAFDGWNGIKGKLPQLGQFQILLNKQVYLYMGHGTGLQHLKEDDVSLLQPFCPMLVFGCCSAKMVFERTQPFGSAFTLLMRGCPAYLGCLWSVTDIDIDLVVEEIFIKSSSENLSLILQSARKKCYLPYINGSSTVVYGLPVRLTR